VVGGGVIGTSIALELARRGVRTTLIERAELAAGASGRNHGLLLTPLESDLVPMAAASLERYRDVAASASFDVSLDREPIGFLVVPMDGDERAAARAEARAAAACGVDVEELAADDLRALEPGLASDAPEAWLLRDGRRLNPALLTVAQALLAVEAGADVRHHLTVRSLLRRGGRVSGVITDDGPVGADAVVVAAGPWSPGLLASAGARLPLGGARGWLVHVAPEGPVVRHLVSRAGWHTLPAPEPIPPFLATDLAPGYPPAIVGALLQPNRDGTMLLGASRQQVVIAEPEDQETPLRIVRQAIRLAPALRDARVLSAWWGVRPTTPDGRPVVGFVDEGLLVATGHGSQGVILGGGTGVLAAAMLTGAPPPFDSAPVRPDRFEA